VVDWQGLVLFGNMWSGVVWAEVEIDREMAIKNKGDMKD
jgi:hypothetical protein